MSLEAASPRESRPTVSGPIVLITRVWPRPDRPSVGAFVRDRARGVEALVVVRPRRRAPPGLLVYLQLLLDALAVTPPIRGVEAHMLIPTGLVGLIVARLRGAPLGIYAHGGDVRNWRTAPAILRWTMRFVAQRADRVWTNSEDTARHLRELGADPAVIPPGVELARFQPSPRPQQRRVLFLGGSTPGKGHEIATAVADTLVGPGLRDIDPSEIPALIADHDVLLVPSIAEAFGLAAVEAIASGRWVVAADVGGLRDVIVDGVNGSLVGDGDFAGALARVPDYDPFAIAPTVGQFGLDRWQTTMAAEWDVLAPRYGTSLERLDT